MKSSIHPSIQTSLRWRATPGELEELRRFKAFKATRANVTDSKDKLLKVSQFMAWSPAFHNFFLESTFPQSRWKIGGKLLANCFVELAEWRELQQCCSAQQQQQRWWEEDHHKRDMALKVWRKVKDFTSARRGSISQGVRWDCHLLPRLRTVWWARWERQLWQWHSACHSLLEVRFLLSFIEMAIPCPVWILMLTVSTMWICIALLKMPHRSLPWTEN